MWSWNAGFTVAMTLAAAVPSAERSASVRSLLEPDSVVWAHTIGPVLQLPLWGDGTAYDAGHFLMVPMHAAFQLGHRGWQEEFAGHFSRFAQAGFSASPSGEGRQQRAQYLYLVSRYLVLSAESNGSPAVPDGLAELASRELAKGWVADPYTLWGQKFSGLKESVDMKLRAGQRRPSYRLAIVDREKFEFAIAADLMNYERLTGRLLPDSKVISEILDFAERTFRQRVVPLSGGGWLFQPGYWSDHPDYRFAGDTAKSLSVTPATIQDIAEDASHSFRFPLWLTSLARAYAPASPQRQYFLQLRDGLSHQFLDQVLVPPTSDFAGFRTRNFMDGRNGLFRWGYKSFGPDDGYGPFETSSAITMGWWCFLATPASRQFHLDLSSQFPLPASVLFFYTRGHKPIDSHRPESVFRDSFANGLREMILRLAAELPLGDQP